MFIQKNNPLYLICLAIVFWGIFKFYSNVKQETAKKIEPQMQTREVKFDATNISESIMKINDVIAEVKQIKSIVIPQFNVTHITPHLKSNKVALCSNSFIIDIQVYNEEGDLVYQNPNFDVSSVASDKIFYETLNKALTLSSEGEKIELFSQNIALLPKFMVKEVKEQPGLIAIRLKKILGKQQFNQASIESFELLNPEKLKKRPSFNFFCKDSVIYKYTLYQTSSSGSKTIKTKEGVIILGKSSTKEDEILEFLILNSREGKLDAIVPSKVFAPNTKDLNLILKGTVIKKDAE